MNHNEITWLIQTTFLDNTQIAKVWYVAESLGCTVLSASVIPFDDNVYIEDEHRLTQNVIPYGSIKLARVTKDKNYKLHFFDQDKFSYTLHNKMRNDMLNSTMIQTTLDNVCELFENTELDDKVFARPLHDNKIFNGGPMKRKDLIDWVSKLKQDKEHQKFLHSEIMIDQLRSIKSESRFFIVDGKVSDGSYYKKNGKLFSMHIGEDDKIYKIAQEKAKGWLPYNCVVMDIAELEDDEYRIVEFNNINSSGFYDHDITKIVTDLTQYAVSIM